MRKKKLEETHRWKRRVNERIMERRKEQIQQWTLYIIGLGENDENMGKMDLRVQLKWETY